MLTTFGNNTYFYQLYKNTLVITQVLTTNTIISGNFIDKYFIRNEYIWQDGFLFDFLQKKTADLWVRQFVIYTGFLFSERFVFENIVKFYLDYFIWPSHALSIFETNNVSDMLNVVIYTYLLMFFVFNTLYLTLFI